MNRGERHRRIRPLLRVLTPFAAKHGRPVEAALQPPLNFGKVSVSASDVLLPRLRRAGGLGGGWVDDATVTAGVTGCRLVAVKGSLQRSITGVNRHVSRHVMLPHDFLAGASTLRALRLLR